MTTLAEQIAGVEVGDWVEARFEYDHAQVVITAPVRFGKEEYAHTIYLHRGTIRNEDGTIDPDLTSIRRVPRPIPSEPERKDALFALLEGSYLVQKAAYDSSAHGPWEKFGIAENTWHSWPEIYPHIVRLYTPSGELVTGFEYYKSEGN